MKRNLLSLALFFFTAFFILTILFQPKGDSQSSIEQNEVIEGSGTTSDEVDTDTLTDVSVSGGIEVPELLVTNIIAGLDHPWDIGFLPTGEFIFTERSNKLNVFMNGNTIINTFSFNDAYVRGEGGVLGLAIDPEFASNRYVYVCLNSSLGLNPEVRVARIKLSSLLSEITERVDIVTGIPALISGRHSGCQLEFDSNNYLWIGTGDAATGSNPQDPGSLGGKILRVDRDGYRAPGNLSFPYDPRIYSYGHRNVQGIAFFPAELGFVPLGISIEQGPAVEDEVNLLSPGNFGWDPIPGYNETVPMTDRIKYPDANKSIFSTPGRTYAMSGGTVISGDQWGDLQGVVVAATLKDEKLTLIKTDKHGKFVATTDILEGQYGRIRTAQMAPDGSMYILTDNGGNDGIYRIVPK